MQCKWKTIACMCINVLVYCVSVSEETQCEGGVCDGPDAQFIADLCQPRSKWVAAEQ